MEGEFAGARGGGKVKACWVEVGIGSKASEEGPIFVVMVDKGVDEG